MARRMPRDPSVLIVPDGGDDLDLYAMPLIDVSRDGCAVESSHALSPASVIPIVELWGDRRLLRRARARVLESIPWRSPDGARRFRMRLRLSPQEEGLPRRSDQLSDARRVRRILEVAALSETIATFELPGGATIRGRLVAAEGSTITLEALESPLVASRGRLAFELFSVSYAMTVRVLRWSGSVVSLSFPLMVSRRQRRYHFRTRVPDGVAVRISGRNLATGERLSRAVHDLSFGGLSFEANPKEDVLWRGLTLEDAKLRAQTGLIPVGEMQITGVDGESCRAQWCDQRGVDSPAFVDLIARLRYPHLDVGMGHDFDGLLRLYREVGLFGPHMTRNLPPVEDRARVVWRKLHATDLCRTLVQREEGRPVAAVSAVRAWEHSWVIQHMAAAPARKHREPGLLHMAYLDYILPRPDGRYMVVFVNTANRPIIAFLEGFFALTGTPEAIASRSVGLWVLRGDGPPPTLTRPSDLVVRALRRRDERVVQRAAERIFTRLGAAALSFRVDDVRLDESRKSFARGGVSRRRRNHIITDRGHPLVALIEDRADPGFNLTWLVNTTWVLPIHSEIRPEDALRAAARHVAAQAEAVGAGDRFVMLPTGFDSRPFVEAGFVHEADVMVNCYNRAGLHRWYYFLRERYGEIRAQRLASKLAEGA